MPVPEEAGAGPARLTVSFDAWPAGRVTPTTVEEPILDAAERAPGEG